MLSLLIPALLPHISALTVGPGKTFARLEQALAAAHPGDSIDVYPDPSGYTKVAARITVSGITIQGIGSKPIPLSGLGADVSGSGTHPRAILEVEPGASDVRIRNFELLSAHNANHNGAGIRVNGADGAQIERCLIHGNDMGVMSNGMRRLVITACHIHHNGDLSDPGYSHNLYLGGEDVTVRHCEIDHALTGHDLKSRCHFTLVEDSYLHDAANRECDFVDATETAKPNSNAAVINSVLVKGGDAAGNHQVIHFGPEKGDRNGGFWFIHCTVITPFAAPVVALNGPNVHAELDDMLFINTQQEKAALASCDGGVSLSVVSGDTDWFSRAYKLTGTSIDDHNCFFSSVKEEDLGVAPPTFTAQNMPVLSIPSPAYYQDGEGNQVEVTPDALFGARWHPLAAD